MALSSGRFYKGNRLFLVREGLPPRSAVCLSYESSSKLYDILVFKDTAERVYQVNMRASPKTMVHGEIERHFGAGVPVQAWGGRMALIADGPEPSLVCGVCFSKKIVLTVKPGLVGSGPRGMWRMGDMGGQSVALCQECGFEAVNVL